MITYPEIINLYGTPISNIPVPYKPFKLNGTHVLIGLVFLGLAGYGLYKIINHQSIVVEIVQKEQDKNLSKKKNNEGLSAN